MSGEPANFDIRDLAYWEERRRKLPAMQHHPGPRPTLGDLHRSTPWVWIHCERCQHRAPFACAVAVIRWGAGASSDQLRERVRCTGCGSKGATIQRPGWAGNAMGFQPFPVSA